MRYGTKSRRTSEKKKANPPMIAYTYILLNLIKNATRDNGNHINTVLISSGKRRPPTLIPWNNPVYGNTSKITNIDVFIIEKIKNLFTFNFLVGPNLALPILGVEINAFNKINNMQITV